MGRILEVQTEHVIPIKTLFEVLKEMLPDAVIDFRRDDIPVTKNKPDQDNVPDVPKNIEDSTANSETADDSDKKKLVVKKKTKLSKASEEIEKLEKLTNKTDDKITDTKIVDKEEKKVQTNGNGGIRIMAVDPSKTVLINLRLYASEFSEFKCKPPKLELGVNLQMFNKLIKSMDKDDILTLFVEEDDEQHLGIQIDNQEKKCKTINKLKLMDLDSQPLRVPPTPFDAQITMSSNDFHKLCRDMSRLAHKSI